MDLARQGPAAAQTAIVPEIDITVGAGHQVTKKFFDKTQVLNTGGEDLFGCTGKNEGQNG
jgi:hypothetical protein